MARLPAPSRPERPARPAEGSPLRASARPSRPRPRRSRGQPRRWGSTILNSLVTGLVWVAVVYSSRWSGAIVRCRDRLAAHDLDVGRYEQGAHPDKVPPGSADLAHRPHPTSGDLGHALGLVASGDDARHAHRGSRAPSGSRRRTQRMARVACAVRCSFPPPGGDRCRVWRCAVAVRWPREAAQPIPCLTGASRPTSRTLFVKSGEL